MSKSDREALLASLPRKQNPDDKKEPWSNAAEIRRDLLAIAEESRKAKEERESTKAQSFDFYNPTPIEIDDNEFARELILAADRLLEGDLHRSLRNDDDRHREFCNRGSGYRLLKQYERAIQDFERAAALPVGEGLEKLEKR
mmetsp:Transcript_98741/g.264023  ORF Transcript_98741/g.264023 Transcript_98741/m.264023 type:complete len:142 (+) Transcript_98741:26-451(+)